MMRGEQVSMRYGLGGISPAAAIQSAPRRVSSTSLNRPRLVAAVLALLMSAWVSADAADSVDATDAPLVRLTFRPATPAGGESDERTLDGKIVAEPEGAGVLFLDRSGRLWPLAPGQITERVETGQRFAPFTQDELAERLKAEMGPDFEIVTTRHYILCTEADREYARWAGSLFERLLSAFKSHWNRPQLDFHEPEFPLVAVILRDKPSYEAFAVRDVGSEAVSAQGYYSNLTNRMVMYDLTSGLSGSRPRNAAELSAKLTGQTANISTIVHEATHQIAFNSGVHARMADNPYWLVEGLAMYFETPDLRSVSGWQTVGRVNPSRLRDYRAYFKARRPRDSLKTMLSSDEPFQTENTALDAYSEAWALTYYLIRERRADYVTYLDRLSKKGIALRQPVPEERVAEFEAVFGELAEVERDFFRYMNKIAR